MRLFIDAIHDGFATCLLGEDESVKVNLPVNWLPGGIAEGMLLEVAIKKVEISPEDESEEIADLFRTLTARQKNK